MEKLFELGTDISLLWEHYWLSYLTGIRNTIVVAVVATIIGCIIGLVCMYIAYFLWNLMGIWSIA